MKKNKLNPFLSNLAIHNPALDLVTTQTEKDNFLILYVNRDKPTVKSDNLRSFSTNLLKKGKIDGLIFNKIDKLIKDTKGMFIEQKKLFSTLGIKEKKSKWDKKIPTLKDLYESLMKHKKLNVLDTKNSKAEKIISDFYESSKIKYIKKKNSKKRS